jgi:hypothetical protein
MQSPAEDDRKSDAEGVNAREHSEYAGSDDSEAEARPHEKGDYRDPNKRVTGRGNASKGPWKEQGGAGQGENYGSRDQGQTPPPPGSAKQER